jgi:hypothetical protein
MTGYLCMASSNGSGSYGGPSEDESSSRIKTAPDMEENTTRDTEPPSSAFREEDTNPRASDAPVEQQLAGQSLPHAFNFEMLLEACNRVVEVHQAQRERDADLFDEKGKFARLLDNRLNNGFTQFGLKIEPRFIDIERKLARVEQAHIDFKSETERRFTEYQKTISDLETEIRELKLKRDAASAESSPSTSVEA